MSGVPSPVALSPVSLSPLALDADQVSPGVLGFVVMALLAVATWLLLRSMNRQLGRISVGEPAESAPDAEPAEDAPVAEPAHGSPDAEYDDAAPDAEDDHRSGSAHSS